MLEYTRGKQSHIVPYDCLTELIINGLWWLVGGVRVEVDNSCYNSRNCTDQYPLSYGFMLCSNSLLLPGFTRCVQGCGTLGHKLGGMQILLLCQNCTKFYHNLIQQRFAYLPLQIYNNRLYFSIKHLINLHFIQADWPHYYKEKLIKIRVKHLQNINYLMIFLNNFNIILLTGGQ